MIVNIHREKSFEILSKGGEYSRAHKRAAKSRVAEMIDLEFF
jgi:hypothetical protein